MSLLVLLVAFAPATLAQSASADEAQAYLQRQASEYGLDATDLADVVVTDSYVSRRSGTTHVYLRQRYNGLEIPSANFTVNLDRSGRVIHATGAFVPSLASQRVAASPALTAEAAARALALDRGLTPTEAFAVQSPPEGRARRALLSDGGVATGPVAARLVYHADERGVLRLAWEVELYERSGRHSWLGQVDAATGEVLDLVDYVVQDSFGPSEEVGTAELDAESSPAAFSDAAPAATGLIGAYRVYPMPVVSPIYTSPLPPADARVLVFDPEDPTASPFGWHDTNGVAGAEFTTTRGNNVHAYTDINADNIPDNGSSPDGGPNLSFDFPLDLTQDPSTYRPAAVTNLFYWSNIIHDVLYQYGFDEVAGNFQQTNYGGSGVGGDYVRAEAQDGSGTNNANFCTPPEGGSVGCGSVPRMQMYIGSNPTPDVDGDFDNHVIVHEYVHGLTNRLTGGPSSVCLGNSEQMGEGWSDWYGLMLTMGSSDTAAMPRTVGNYLFGQADNGPGIRPAPYSTDFGTNGFTYQDSRTQVVPHGVGFVWSTILWEVTWDLIDAYGFDEDLYNADGTAGNQIVMNLVTEALKMQPCSPGFVDGRDAILAADAALYPDPNNPGQGLHYDTLWQAFARRGLGVSADQGSPGSNADNTEAFDVPLPPPVLDYSPGSISIALQPDELASVPVTLSNLAPGGSSNLSWQAIIQNATDPLGQSAPAFTSAVRGGDGGATPAAMQEPKGEDRFAGTGTASLTGGPDAFGYTFTDSDEPGGPAVDFQDISSTGTAVTWTPTGTFPAGDEGYADVALPFPFPFYGTERTSVRVLSNGFLTFSSFASNSFTNQAIPSSGAPNDMIAPFWDDLDQSAGGEVYVGTLPDGRFVVQYDGVPRWGTSSAETFQVILSDDGTIEFQYATMTGTLNSATVGVENATGTVALPIVINAAYVTSNKAVRIAPPVMWVMASPGSGDVAPGSDASFDVEFDATDLSEGIYTADLVITTNDPEASSVTIPIELEVAATLEVDISVVLAGGYDAIDGVMRTDLAAGEHLPSGHPFAARGHVGSETADPGVFTGVDPPVDWVLIHLRATPDGANLASRAAFVLYDGIVVDIDGASPVAFAGMGPGSYYVVVEARNHLSVMSAAPVDFSGGSGFFDFTTALSQAHPGASAAMTEVDAGVWALWAGDANDDGQVTVPDFNAWSASTSAGTTGYDAADFNLDGQVTVPDFNLWSAATAAGAETAVPLASPPPSGVSARPGAVAPDSGAARSISPRDLRE